MLGISFSIITITPWAWADVQGLVNDAQDTVKDTAGNVQNQVDNTVGGVKDTVDDAVEGVKDTVDNTVDGVKDTVDKVQDQVDNVQDKVDDPTGGAIDDTVDDTQKKIDDTVDRGDDVLGDVIGKDPAGPVGPPDPPKPPDQKDGPGGGNVGVGIGSNAQDSGPGSGNSAGERDGIDLFGAPSLAAAETGAQEAGASSSDEADGLVESAVEAARRFAFPLALTLLVAAFLAIQNRIDSRDPKFALAAADDEFLAFE